jgi:hypothetical protein
MDQREPIYVSPQVEVMEIEIEQTILQTSNFDPQEGNWI